ncbi:MAG: hypothetical protein FWH43_07200 [Endomicrobia bacterium]|nr:hypothetical protein [Endomicrobiia bacterium]
MKKILALALLLSVCTTQAFALFDTSYWGVRALGMGGAFTAVADDVEAPIYNISGMADMEKAEIMFMSAKLFSGLDGLDMSTDYLGFAYPVSEKIGTFSINWSYFGDAGLRREDSVSLGYARTLDDILDFDWVNLLAGLNFRYLRHEARYNGSDLSKEAFAFDIGLLASFKYGISIGYSGRYFNRPDIGFKQKDEIKQTNVVGIAYYSEELPLIGIPRFTAAVDYEMREGDNHLIFGIESKIIEGNLALRAGGWEEQINFGTGYGFDFGNRSRLSIDYAFGLPLKIQETTGSHFLSLTFRFP